MTSSFQQSALFFEAVLLKVQCFESDSAVSCLKLSIGASNEVIGCRPFK